MPLGAFHFETMKKGGAQPLAPYRYPQNNSAPLDHRGERHNYREDQHTKQALLPATPSTEPNRRPFITRGFCRYTLSRGAF